MSKSAADLRRVQFDLLPDRLAELDQLMAFCDLKTRKDLFDNAMTLFEWAVQEVRTGKEIASYNRSTDHVEVVRFPVLDNAARRAKARPVELVSTAAAGTETDTEHAPSSKTHRLVHRLVTS
jgi:hypothetical protein